MKRKLQIVRWVDSASTPRWRYTHEIDPKPSECVTVGFVIHANRKAITLAQTARMDKGYEEDVNACMTIPRGCIKSIRNLK